jgi:alkanesulfonate monooxygenase SsuD/methylene tetrahydromethanopterin reductase-like flavin-dependent oxidoreductase (luciferase family)
MKVSIMIEAAFGLTWPLWKQLIPILESMGFNAIFRSDHFPLGSPGATNALELITSLTYLADHTQRVNFGSLVAPASFREPVMLARQAMALNDLSGGRMVLGVGTGWNKEEHRDFGYELGDVKTRADRFAEGLEVISCLMREEQPVNFQGQFFHLHDAHLLPRPQQPTRILVGGNGPKRTLPLVARYADLWNCQIASVETFRDLSAQLDQHLLAIGRKTEDVKRTVMNPILAWQTKQEFNQMMNLVHQIPIFRDLPEQGLSGMITSMNGCMGSPEQVVEFMQAYEDAGVDEFVISWILLENWTGLEILAKEVLPHFM